MMGKINLSHTFTYMKQFPGLFRFSANRASLENSVSPFPAHTLIVCEDRMDLGLCLFTQVCLGAGSRGFLPPWLEEPIIFSTRWDPQEPLLPGFLQEKNRRLASVQSSWVSKPHSPARDAFTSWSQPNPGAWAYFLIKAKPIAPKTSGTIYLHVRVARHSRRKFKAFPLCTDFSRRCTWYSLPFTLSSTVYGT